MRTPRPKPRLEKLEQADGVKLLRMLGAAVYVLGTTRRAGDHQGTMQTQGLPDVEAFLPAKAGHPSRLVKWEVKRERGSRVRPEQIDYAANCQVAGVAYVIGTARALIAWLIEQGYLPNPSKAPQARTGDVSPCYPPRTAL